MDYNTILVDNGVNIEDRKAYGIVAGFCFFVSALFATYALLYFLNPTPESANVVEAAVEEDIFSKSFLGKIISFFSAI